MSVARLLLLLSLCVSAAARADGAFPDSMQIMLPPDRPQEIVLATNFGLLVSRDEGTTWEWVCEDSIGACAHLYQMNAVPSDTITTLTAMGLVVLRDGLCTHELSQGLFVAAPTDVFLDPLDPAHAFAIGLSSTGRSALYESRDRGLTFATELYEADAGVTLTGVENARAAGRTVYLTAARDQGGVSTPLILRSADGGSSFSSFDQSTLGAARLSLAAVDRDDAQKLYLRVSDASTQVDSLALSEDGGSTSTITLSFPPQYQMTALLEEADGTILATGLRAYPGLGCSAPDLTSSDPVAAYRSTDGGHHFDPWSGAPHVRALGERAGVLYAAANSVADGFALATSKDQGAHWTPILRFGQIKGPLACEASDCAAAWGQLKKTFGIMETGADGGSGPMTPEGCSCSIGAEHHRGLVLASVLVMVVGFWRARRQGRVVRDE